MDFLGGREEGKGMKPGRKNWICFSEEYPLQLQALIN